MRSSHAELSTINARNDGSVGGLLIAKIEQSHRFNCVFITRLLGGSHLMSIVNYTKIGAVMKNSRLANK